MNQLLSFKEKLLKCIRTPKEININVRGSIYNMATTDQVSVERLIALIGWYRMDGPHQRFTVSARVVWKETKHCKIITFHFFICHKYNANFPIWKYVWAAVFCTNFLRVCVGTLLFLNETVLSQKCLKYECRLSRWFYNTRSDCRHLCYTRRLQNIPHSQV